MQNVNVYRKEIFYNTLIILNYYGVVVVFLKGFYKMWLCNYILLYHQVLFMLLLIAQEIARSRVDERVI